MELVLSFLAAVSSFSFSAVQARKVGILDELMEDPTFLASYEEGEYAISSEEVDYQLISFQEVGYDRADMSRYALYMYVWNPTKLRIVNESFGMNSVEIRSNVFGGRFSDGVARFEKYPISKVEEEQVGDSVPFYKFRVEVPDRYLFDELPAERIYSVSGFELLDSNGLSEDVWSPHEYAVDTTYTFSGFMEGCEGSEESTLSCSYEQLKTISLDVDTGYYRTGTNSSGTQNDIFWALFSVPDDILKEYGALQKVHAEWWKYDLDPIFVYEVQGALFGIPPDNYSDFISGSHRRLVLSHESSSPSATDVWSKWPSPDYVFEHRDWETIPGEEIESLFFEAEGNGDHLYDPESEENLAAYHDLVIDAGEGIDIPSWGDTHSGWDTFWESFFNGFTKIEMESIKNLPAIEEVGNDYSDLAKYYVREEDRELFEGVLMVVVVAYGIISAISHYSSKKKTKEKKHGKKKR